MMRVIAFILFILVFGVSASGQSSTSYDVEFSRICLIDSIAPDTLTQFWRFTQANNPGGITRDYTYDLAGGYNVSGTVVPCCSCLTAASDTAALEVPGGLGTNNWGDVGILIFVAGMLGFLVLMNIWAKTKAARFACTIFFLTLIPVSQGFAQSETLYDVEFSQICLIDSIAPDTIVQFWRFTHANNPGGITRDFTYDLSGAYIPTGTVIGCNDYYLGDNPEGSGTAGTLAIWTGTETLGNSSLTESGEEAAWDLTGSLTVPSGTDAQVPVWGAGKLRYNTTGGGFQGGANGYYLPWASSDNFSNALIPYSDGSKLISSSNFFYGTSSGVNVANGNFVVRTSGKGLQHPDTGALGLYFNSSDPKIRFYTGSTYVRFQKSDASEEYARIGDNLGEFDTNELAGNYGIRTNALFSLTSNLVISGITGTQKEGGSVTIEAGQGTNEYKAGNVYIRGGDILYSNNPNSQTGDVIISLYPNSQTLGATNTPVNMMHFRSSGTVLERTNIEIYRLNETPGETTDRILTMQDDTLKYRVFAYAEMSIDDANPDTISITSGTPAEGTDWTAGELANFTYSAGRLTYTGTETAKFLINTTVSFSFNVGNTVIEAWIYKNGGEVTKSELHRKIGTAGDVGNGGQTCILELAQNDYIELFFDAASNGNVIIQNANVNLVKI